MRINNSKKAFSIIELVFVIVVLAIIIGVAAPKFLETKARAEATTIKEDIMTISTSVQSYYMLNNKIDKISDAVKINSSRWIVSDTKLEYKVDGVVCTTIEILDNKLTVKIAPSSSPKCQKLSDLGIVDSEVELY